MEEVIAENLSPEAVTHINQWLTEPKYAEYRDQLEQMITAGEWNTLEDAFFKVIEFGTGGRRGVTGIGSNRINKVTMGESAQALCNYAKSVDPDAPSKGVVIAYDTRLSSPELSQFVARVCAANGYKTYIFENFRSTPELSFAVRYLGCAVGIVITASHNPSADNGFKAYWNDGAQIVPPHDKGVLDAVSRQTEIVATESFEGSIRDGSIILVGSEVDKAYLAAVVDQTEGTNRDIKIAFSPLHGVGQTNTLPALRKAGFEDIEIVDEQMIPDGSFPTLPGGKANPEEVAANDMVVAKMLQTGADIAITNDLDADRIGIMVNHFNRPVYLSGNQSAVLAADYSLKKLQQKGELSSKNYLVKTIVTTDMLKAIAEKYGVNIYDNLLIGFKYIGEVIRSKENTDEKFVMGGEESFGMLKGDYARDKDAATGALPVAEYAAELKAEGKTLVDRLDELYRELGLFVETLESTYYEGADGFATMQNIMTSFRDDSPSEIGGEPVTAVLDYKNLTRKTNDGKVSKIDCKEGNVLVFELGDERRRITIRPSGTEPKLKFYMQWYQATDNPEEDINNAKEYMSHLFKCLSEDALRRVA